MKIKLNDHLKKVSSISILSLIIGSACTTVPVREGGLAVSEKTETSQSDFMRNHSKESLLKDIIAADHDFEAKEHFAIPSEAEEWVRKWVNYFTVTDRARFETFLSRGAIYREEIHKILDEVGVPHAIYYLAMIESGFVSHATSTQSAVGPWQFIKATGRRYGLQVNRFVDDRRDIIASTRAAAKYLKDLHQEFNSWYLALAGYNAGEGRIRRVIRENKSNDFWYLISIRKLPKETSNYVPKFLAAIIVGENAEKFGFSPKKFQPFPIVAKVAVPASVHLFEIAQASGIDYQELKLVNAHLKYEVTPDHLGDFEIYAPVGNVQSILAARDRFKKTIVVAKSTRKKTNRVALKRSKSSVKGRVLASVKKAKSKNKKLIREKKSQAKNDRKVEQKGSV